MSGTMKSCIQAVNILRGFCLVLLSTLSEEVIEVVKVQVKNISYYICCHNKLEINRGKTLIGEEKVLIYLAERMKENGVFYDIGANIGTHSIFIGKAFHKVEVIAFEAEKKNYTHLLKNIRFNHCSNIDCYNIAAGDKQSQEELFLYRKVAGEGGNSLVELPGKTTQTVMQWDLDSFVGINEISPPDLIKIDVEGYEMHVIKGMKEIISTYSPEILIEIHPKYLIEQFNNERVVHEYMESLGYEVIEIPNLIRDLQNFIYCIPKEKEYES